MPRGIENIFRIIAPARRHLPALLGAGLALSCAMPAAGQALPQAGAGAGPGRQQVGDWQLFRAHDSLGGADRVSIMRTADVDASDAGFAGMTIRCGKEGRLEWLLVFLEAFSVQMKPKVTLEHPPLVFRSDSTVVAPGTAVLLPEEAGSWLTNNPGQDGDLLLRVEFGETAIRGRLRLGRLAEALALLKPQCM